jgi:hypothetical protein
MRGPKHKRYLLLTSEAPIAEEAKKEIARKIAKISPVMAKKAVWYDRAVIVRTDNVDLPMVREALEVGAGEVRLRSTLTSGAIGKLKRAVPK